MKTLHCHQSQLSQATDQTLRSQARAADRQATAHFFPGCHLARSTSKRSQQGIQALGLLLAALCTQGVLLLPGLAHPSNNALQAAYRAAIQDAAFVELEEDVNTLIPITPDNPLLVWNSTKTHVLVVTWKSQSVYERYLKPNTQSSKREDQLLWVTVAPQVQAFCQRYLQQHPQATEADLTLRLKQYLGLNPSWEYDRFVELWVSPHDLFRPCVNPDITQRYCPLNFVGVPPKVTGHTPGAGIQDYQSFYQTLYFRSIRAALQPWTGLGYTYDWGSPISHVGASEFILVPGATYAVKQATPTLQYC
ncbi:hypothetical protein H6F43_02480, partial [Leptolyngbya sp. FACHB-36]|uniref:hypothetical protein n=1 Tax=Leptolyngbya sp. FACHB-36 TaxID=2692808 RepID=UPI001681910B